MDELQGRVNLAIESGDAAELRRLLSSDWGTSWTAKRAEQVYREIVAGNGKSLTAGQALKHALLVAFAMANELSVAKATCNALKRRLEELEARPAAVYAGVWQESETPYSAGEVCTHGGTIWFCHVSTHARPGQSDDWQMMVKNK